MWRFPVLPGTLQGRWTQELRSRRWLVVQSLFNSGSWGGGTTGTHGGGRMGGPSPTAVSTGCRRSLPGLQVARSGAAPVVWPRYPLLSQGWVCREQPLGCRAVPQGLSTAGAGQGSGTPQNSLTAPQGLGHDRQALSRQSGRHQGGPSMVGTGNGSNGKVGTGPAAGLGAPAGCPR